MIVATVKWYREDGTGYLVIEGITESVFFDRSIVSVGYEPERGDKVLCGLQQILGRIVAADVRPLRIGA